MIHRKVFTGKFTLAAKSLIMIWDNRTTLNSRYFSQITKRFYFVIDISQPSSQLSEATIILVLRYQRLVLSTNTYINKQILGNIYLRFKRMAESNNEDDVRCVMCNDQEKGIRIIIFEIIIFFCVMMLALSFYNSCNFLSQF